jgi:localization factor PodJL
MRLEDWIEANMPVIRERSAGDASAPGAGDLEAIIGRMAARREAGPSRHAPSSEGFEGRGRTAATLDSMARRIDMAEDRLNRASRAAADQQDRLAAALSQTLADLRDRLETVERRPMPALAPVRIEFPVQETAKALSPIADSLVGLRSDLTRLTGKLEPLELDPAPALSALQGEMEKVQSALAGLATRAEVQSIDQEIRKLADKAATGGGSDVNSLVEAIGELQNKVQLFSDNVTNEVYRKVSAQIDLLKQRVKAASANGVDRTVIEFLSSQIVDLRQDLGQRAEPKQIAKLSEDVAVLGRQLADVRLNIVKRSDFGTLKTSLEDICAMLSRSVAAQAHDEVPKQLASLGERVDELLERPEPRVTNLEPVARQLAIMTERMTALASRQAAQHEDIAGLMNRISTKLEEASGSASTQPLLARFDNLEEELRQVARSADTTNTIQMLRSLDEKLERQPGTGLDALEQRLVALTDEMAQVKIPVDHASDSLAEIKQEAAAIAEQAARAALAGIQPDASSDIDALKQGFVELKALHLRSDKKTHETLRSLQESFEQFAARSQPASAPDLSADRLEAAVRKLHDAAIAQAEEVATRDGEPAEPAAEPGCEPQQREETPGVVATTVPLSGDQSGVRAGLIAAARRAARMSVREAVAPKIASAAASNDPQSDAPVPANIITRLKNTLESNRRPMLFGVAFLILAAGTMQVVAALNVTSEPQIAAALQLVPGPGAAVPGFSSDPKPISRTSTEELPDSIPMHLRKAALRGDAAAVFHVAARLTDGVDAEREPALAARYFERAAKAGLAPAQERFAMMLEKGVGVVRDPKQAAAWYERAALGGNTRAMHNLATLLASGLGGKPDYAAALRWYLEAAEAGVRDSQFNIGVLFARSVGGRQDLGQAYKWFALAAAQGDVEAVKRRDEVAGKLRSEELASARHAVSLWRPRVVDILANEVPDPEAESAKVAAAADRI